MIPAIQPALPPDLKTTIPVPRTPWNISALLFKRIREQASSLAYREVEVQNTDPEFKFILKYFEHQKPSGFSIKRIVCVHNAAQTVMFETTLKNLESEASSPVFLPKGKEEEPKADRARVLNRWASQVAQFSPLEVKDATGRVEDCVKAKILPLWHGTSRVVCKSICNLGFTYFGKHHCFDEAATKGVNKSTDKGYFGSGIYFTNSAQYAAMYSAEKILMLAWVSMREPYPVVNDVALPEKGTDMRKLAGQHAYQNYNAHFIPVVSIKPHDPKCMEYYPCYKDQKPDWDECVVFHQSQTLPRFYVELAVDFPKAVAENVTFEALQTLLNELLNNKEVQRQSSLNSLLRAKRESILKLSKTALVKPKDKDFYHLAKRLINEKGNLDLQIMKLLGDQESELPHSRANRPLPSPSQPLNPPVPGEADYQKALQFEINDNLKEAFTYFQKAALLGHVGSQFKTAVCYKKGIGVSKSEQEAIKWCLLAAEQGHSIAQNTLGICYKNGEGVTQNYKEALKWFLKAAEQGDPSAQANLGNCYQQGKGVPQDDGEAVKWYLKSAENGNPSGQYYLGLCYMKGQGVSQNYTDAVKWFRKAADQGNADAQYYLGICYQISDLLCLQSRNF